MVLLTIWPLFALICLGYGLAKRGFPRPDFWDAAEKLTYFILFPALLVRSLSNAPVRDPEILKLGGAAVVSILLAVAAMAVARRARPMAAARFGPAVQGVIRFNTYLGLAITAALAGDPGLERAAVYLAIAVPVVNVISIIALTEGNPLRRPGLLINSILRNPLILACLAGIALSLTGIGLPHGSDALFAMLGQGSLPLGLLCVGAALQPRALRRDLGALGAVTAARLLAMPLLAWVVAHLFGLGQVETLVLVIFCGIPTATASYVLTQQLKGDGTFMAGIVTGQTAVAVLTLPVVIWLLG
ncbi:MAG: AEC family transporter [Pseudomonadota bacterium]|nr:AEC family transporter [Pseudomonadota bacterium]MEC8667306.1 AEC family transporter [Pseudomonadota bacterium]